MYINALCCSLQYIGTNIGGDKVSLQVIVQCKAIVPLTIHSMKLFTVSAGLDLNNDEGAAGLVIVQVSDYEPSPLKTPPPPPHPQPQPQPHPITLSQPQPINLLPYYPIVLSLNLLPSPYYPTSLLAYL